MVDTLREAFLVCWAENHLAACVVGDDGTIRGVNDVWTRSMGEGAEGQPLVTRVHPEDAPLIFLELQKAKAGRRAAFTARFLYADGSFQASAFVAWRARGGVIVARRPSRDAVLPDDFMRARPIMDSLPTFLVAIGNDGRVIFMNRTMRDALGWIDDDPTGLPYASAFVPEREREALLRLLANPLKNPSAGENHVLAKDGSEIPVEWHGRAFEDDDGIRQGSFAVGFDVRERRRMRGALMRSEQKLALHFQQAPLGMIEWSPQFRVLEWNPAAERIFGWSREEALGQHGLSLMVPEEARAQVSEVWIDALGARGAVRSVNENVTRDGRTIVCSWCNTALIDEEGQVIGVASLVEDVTDRERAAEAQRERERAQVATIEKLSAPVIDLWKGVLAMPVIGPVDEQRATRMTESLLEAIVRAQAQITIVDLTGATDVTAATAEHLRGMMRAARLLGTRCLVSGISPAMARTLVEISEGMPEARTFGTLRDALRHAIGLVHQGVGL
jgi:PAS domain S-box-containing protein